MSALSPPARTLRRRVILVTALLCLAAAGCGAGASAACAPLTRKERLAAPVIVEGTFTAGPTAEDGVLVSPAALEVRRYVKGEGPAVVKVTTRELGGGSVGAEGIDPKAGETWRVYAERRGEVLATSVCEGSHRLRRRPS